MRSTSLIPPLLRAVLAVGLCGAAFVACSADRPGEEPAPAAHNAPAAPASTQARLDYSPVPSDFPPMLGCSPEEISYPDALIQAQCQKLCDGAQLGLYQLSLQTDTLGEDELKQLSSSIMLTTLEKLAVIRESANSYDGGMPPP